MATRALVGIENADGTRTSIYVHYDGYPTGVGLALYRHYTSEAEVRSLMLSGDHSTLDRPEPWEGAYGDGSDAIITTGWPDVGQEWVYLWRDGQWFGASYDWTPTNRSPEVRLIPLRTLLEQHHAEV